MTEQARLADELTYLRRQHDLLAEQAASQAEVQPELRSLELRITRLLEELRLAGADDLEGLSLLEGRVYSPQALLDRALRSSSSFGSALTTSSS